MVLKTKTLQMFNEKLPANGLNKMRRYDKLLTKYENIIEYKFFIRRTFTHLLSLEYFPKRVLTFVPEF